MIIIVPFIVIGTTIYRNSGKSIKMMKSCFMFFEQTNLVLESVHNNGIVGGAKENFKSVAESHNEKTIMDNGEIEI